MDILQEIAERTKLRVEEKKKERPAEQVMGRALSMGAEGFPFEETLRQPGVSLICEIKRASPSKGIIAEDFPYMDIAAEYEEAGAAAISVLTEPYYFKGSDRYLEEIAGRVNIPLLRKDFVVDSYMIYEAKLLGAHCVLLICALTVGDELAEYIRIAGSLGLSALVEAHDEEEIRMALDAGAGMIGVNNRDLRTFEVDLSLGCRLRAMTPEGIIFVSESGINTAEDISRLREAGADAALVGESLMRSPDRISAVRRLLGESHG